MHTKVLDFEFISPFVGCAFGAIYKKKLPNPKSRRFNPIFSSNSFLVLAVTFWAMIHFKLIFQYVVLRSLTLHVGS